MQAWTEFRRGKKGRSDVQEFERQLMDGIIELHADLMAGTYQHSVYQAFSIADPKPRSIHKASIRDRLLHHALYRKLCPTFDRKFIFDSYSCRKGKGTHRALQRFRQFSCIVSQNHTRTVWVLKCDVRKFFASIDQKTLIEILRREIEDARIVSLLTSIIRSFDSGKEGTGLPLGNLTSQLLVNIYMNDFDQYMKHRVKAKYYIRYADDFVIFSHERTVLETMLLSIREFLWEKLRLTLHPDKIFIRTVVSGVDFLGWVHFPDHRVLRRAARRRMIRRVQEVEYKKETVESYKGLLRWGNTRKIRKTVLGEGDERRE